MKSIIDRLIPIVAGVETVVSRYGRVFENTVSTAGIVIIALRARESYVTSRMLIGHPGQQPERGAPYDNCRMKNIGKMDARTDTAYVIYI